jgi:PLP dependent protein
MNNATPAALTIATRLTQLHARMACSCTEHHRRAADVCLLAVSKTMGLDALRAACAAGQRHFGENYIQEGLEKIQALATERTSLGLVWHCIGPVQSNKTRQVAEHFDWVHSVDRLKTAQRLSEQRPVHLPPLQVCLQVNVDDEPSKAGLAPAQVSALAQAVLALPRLQLRGLMSIPEAATGFSAQLRPHLALKAVFDELNAALRPQGVVLDTLSMGMSADFEAAIAAGSTMVRVGTALFGQRV